MRKMLLLFILGNYGNWGRTIRNVKGGGGGGGGVGNFRAAGILFRYQIPFMNLCLAVAGIFFRVNWRA